MSKEKSRKAKASKRISTTLGTGDGPYDHTVSPDGTIEASIFMHSRMGIRMEFNIHRSKLSLWISPLAGKSVDYRDRNFSNRDDHTSIFDVIDFPELKAGRFVKCDYDPFHSVLCYEDQRLHIASLLDKPVVLLWFEKEGVVDFKTDKQDTLVERTKSFFHVRHPDRGRLFDFCVAAGEGTGVFQHQPEVDTMRSAYARVVMPAGRLLVIGGELKQENIRAIVARVATRPVAALLATNEKLIADALKPGTLKILGNPEMQKLYDTNKRHLLSAQDASGALRAALKYVYYLIWTTDGSVTATHMIQTGWQDFMKRWLEFLLANPTEQENPPAGRFYGQLTNGKITKREEFGSLCAVWAAFMHFGLTGDNKFISGKYLAVLEDAVDWLERYCYDPKIGAIGTFYLAGGSEDPFYGSNDFGWDAAVGSFLPRNFSPPLYKGHRVLRAYEFSMNLNQFNMYLMLAAATSGEKSARYRKKAAGMETFLKKLLALNASAYYLLDKKGLTLIKRPPGERECGLLAVQSRSPAFFMPDFPTLFMNRMNAFVLLTPQSIKGHMPCYVYGMLAGLDTEFVDENEIFRSLEATLDSNIKSTPLMPMAYTMVETLGAREGDYHDIRPQAFSAGPFQGAITNLAVRTMPFGIALRATSHVKELNHFEYLDGYLDIKYSGSGSIDSIRLNGRFLKNTLQIPDTLVREGANNVAVTLAAKTAATPTLVYSTVRLSEMSIDDNLVRYQIRAFCRNTLIFRDLRGVALVKDSRGHMVGATHEYHGRHTFVEFDGLGDFTVEVLLG